MTLKAILYQGQVFKLVCGAGNEDVKEVEQLVYIYAKAGCQYFDISANMEVLVAARKGLERANVDLDKYYLNVSVGIQGDPHIGVIDKNKCKNCSQCIAECPFGAKTYKSKQLDIVLRPLIATGWLSSIEYHAISKDHKEVNRQWSLINDLIPRNMLLSLCLDRSVLSDQDFINRVKGCTFNKDPMSVIVQADGCPMSGGKDDWATTLQAVAAAQLVAKARLPVFLLVSGGTNTHTRYLCDVANIPINGIAVGSFARKIVLPFLDDEEYAIEIARDFIRTTRS